MSKLIIENVIRVDQETIEVTAATKVSSLAMDKKVFYRGSDVRELVTEYEIVELIEDHTIANTKRGNYKQRATWFFKVKKRPQARKKPPTPKKPDKPAAAPAGDDMQVTISFKTNAVQLKDIIERLA